MLPALEVRLLPDQSEKDLLIDLIGIKRIPRIGISEEAANALRAKIDKGEWKLNAFEADFTFETDHYKTEIGLFGYLPKHNKGETLTKKIFRLKDTLMVDTMKLWDIIINKMPRGDNEFLKKLDLSEPNSW